MARNHFRGQEIVAWKAVWGLTALSLGKGKTTSFL